MARGSAAIADLRPIWCSYSYSYSYFESPGCDFRDSEYEYEYEYEHQMSRIRTRGYCGAGCSSAGFVCSIPGAMGSSGFCHDRARA